MKKNLLSLFHHIHHDRNKHEVHHCGEKHAIANPKLNYVIRHCKCGKHSIGKKIALGHATGKNLDLIEIEIKFSERCPYSG